MQLQRGGQIETLGAHGTNIRPFAGMNSHMNFEVAHPSELFLASFALKRPFASVCPHVTFEAAHLSEPFLAGFALKRPFTSVRSHMTI